VTSVSVVCAGEVSGCGACLGSGLGACGPAVGSGLRSAVLRVLCAPGSTRRAAGTVL
jgi:hypothetical protein